MDADGAKQIAQMVSFILHEAQQKKLDIDRKAKEEFNISKMQIVKEMREKVRKEYATKLKKHETKQAIARSTAINAQRLQKASARTAVMEGVADSVKEKLTGVVRKEKEYKQLLQKLMTQGALKLLETQVTVSCREEDRKHVESQFATASSEYTRIIKKQANVDRSVSFVLDKTNLKSVGPKKVIGGVVLSCHGGLIKVDNTLDVRLKLCDDQDKPAIRQLLFPQANLRTSR